MSLTKQYRYADDKVTKHNCVIFLVFPQFSGTAPQSVNQTCWYKIFTQNNPFNNIQKLCTHFVRHLHSNKCTRTHTHTHKHTHSKEICIQPFHSVIPCYKTSLKYYTTYILWLSVFKITSLSNGTYYQMIKPWVLQSYNSCLKGPLSISRHMAMHWTAFSRTHLNISMYLWLSCFQCCIWLCY
jgi:hypothetical protein